MARGLLPLSEVLSHLDEVGLEGRPVFILPRPPRPEVFRVMDRIRYESVGNTYELCL